MPYKISGTKSETGRIIIIKESDWSIESETVVSGSGAYEIDGLEVGNKTVVARSTEGEMLGYGNVASESYTPAAGDRGVFGGGFNRNTIDYITISSTGNATDFGDFDGNRYGIQACSNGASGRGLFAGGNDQNIIDYITISTTSNTTDFGDLTVTRYLFGGLDNGTNDRGIFAGVYPYWAGGTNAIDYVTISTPGNAANFGDLYQSNWDAMGACSNDTNNRGLFGGGGYGEFTDAIDYITISSLGNAADFGNLTVVVARLSGCSNGTNNRGVFGGGMISGATNTNVIGYVTITSLGNATNFGDLTIARRKMGATSNKTNDRGVFGGGYSGSVHNTIDYITITSTGNATYFGDLTDSNRYLVAATANT